MINFSVKPTFQAIAARAKRWEAQLRQNKLIAYKRSAAWLHKWVMENFEGEGDKVGKWAPFSPVTLRSIERTDPGRMPAKLLQKTGALRQSFLPFATSTNAGVGSKLDYSKKHEEGEGRLPARRMLPRRGEVIKPLREILATTINFKGTAKDA